MIGKASVESWFQTPVTATASPTGPLPNPQERSIEYEPAIPTAAPAGETSESAVEAWLIMNAWRKPIPGSAAIQGGANVTRLITVATVRTTASSQPSVFITLQTSR